MCGISAVVGYGDPVMIRRMHAEIAHRGPDGEGFLSWNRGEKACRTVTAERLGDAEVQFGFRWLAIQDLEVRASQPLISFDGRYVLVYNGEIYNFVELRRELEREGQRFRTLSDTEVLMAAWQRWGTAALGKFEGMWAFLILDTFENILWGSRDRIGIKPLFWAREGDRLLFASEIKQLCAARKGTPQPDSTHAWEFLNGRRARRGHGTSIEGVQSVPSGTFFRVDLRGRIATPQFVRWWTLDARSPTTRTSDQEHTDEIRSLLVDSVRAKRRSRVSQGALISGGLDSSLLAAFASSEGAAVTGVSLITPDRPEADESRWIDDVSRKFGIRSHRVRIDSGWVSDNLDRVTAIQDEPLIASTLLAQNKVLTRARELGLTVMMDGQGADEVFGGYFFHQFAAWRERLSRFEPAAFTSDLSVMSDEFSLSRARLVVRHLIRPSAVRLLAGAAAGVTRYSWLTMESRPRETMELIEPLREQLKGDVLTRLLPPLLLYSDRNGMASSVEVRLPFLDHRLIERAMRLPDHLLVTPGKRKVVLRRIAEGLLPDSVTSRTDTMGFVTPEQEWLRGPLRKRVRDELEAAHLNQWVDRRKALSWIDRFNERGHSDFRSVWRLMSFAIWLRSLERLR